MDNDTLKALDGEAEIEAARIAISSLVHHGASLVSESRKFLHGDRHDREWASSRLIDNEMEIRYYETLLAELRSGKPLKWAVDAAVKAADKDGFVEKATKRIQRQQKAAEAEDD